MVAQLYCVTESTRRDRPRCKIGIVVSIWMLAWATGVALFLLPIVLIMAASSVLRMHRQGVRRPFLIVLKRALSWVPLQWFDLPGSGATALLAWDLRWMYAGQTNARVVAVDEVSGRLVLELELPIPVIDASGHERGGVGLVEFLPAVGPKAPYRWLAVRGTLLPSVGGVTPTAEVVVYR